MNGMFTPLPPDDKYKKSKIYIESGVEVSMRFADKRKLYTSYKYVIRTDYKDRPSMAAYGVADNRKVVVYLPASFANAPPAVMSEVACDTMRRITDPDRPMYGGSAMAYFNTDRFRNQRMTAIGGIGDAPLMNRLRAKRYESMSRAMREMLNLLDERHPHLVHLMNIYRIRFIPLVPGVAHDVAVYPDPYSRIVFYDMKALDPINKREACFSAMYRSCAFITAFDRRNCRLNEKHFMALLDACPEARLGMRICEEYGIKLPVYPCEERRLLPCTTSRSS